MTPIELVQDEARQLHVELPSDIAEMILWEHTGFPSFYELDPESDIRWDVRAYLEPGIRAWRLSFPLPPSTAPTVWDCLDEENGL